MWSGQRRCFIGRFPHRRLRCVPRHRQSGEIHYASVRVHQERRYPGRVAATDLTNPDFATLAQAHGLGSETVTRTEEFPAAFERAAAAGRATIIELRTDHDRVGARTVLSRLREQAVSSADRR